MESNVEINDFGGSKRFMDSDSKQKLEFKISVTSEDVIIVEENRLGAFIQYHIDTREQAIREALINLGWKPPVILCGSHL